MKEKLVFKSISMNFFVRMIFFIIVFTANLLYRDIYFWKDQNILQFLHYLFVFFVSLYLLSWCSSLRIQLIIETFLKSLLTIVIFYNLFILCLNIFISGETGGHGDIKDMIFILLETNMSEGWDFILMNEHVRNSIFLFLSASTLYVFLSLKVKGSISSKYPVILFLLFFIFHSTSFIKNSLLDLSIFRYVSKVVEYNKDIKAYKNLKVETELKKTIFRASYSEKSPDKVVLIIGESASRSHMSYHGYFRDTNLFTKQLGQELAVFNDVISPHSHTITALPKLFTMLDNENDDKTKWFEHPTLCDIFKEAGFDTYWISAQEAYSIFNYDNTSTLIGKTCEKQYFATLRKQDRIYDTDLIPEIEKVLNGSRNKKQFIVVHLMGSHSYYPNRTPDGFKAKHKFKPIKDSRPFLDDKKKNIIDAYDHSILFADKFVYDIINMVKNTGDKAVVIYTSDHGEEVYDSRDYVGHTEDNGSRYMCEIPLFVWPSEFVDVEYLSRPYMTDIFPHTILELADIESEIFDPTKSLINDSFIQRERVFNNRNYDLYYKDFNVQHIVSYLPEKLWAHRVNSIDKLNLVQFQVSGVEIDIVIKDRFIDVNHPPARSIGLSLSEYLDTIENEDLKIWLDIKTDQPLSEKQINMLAKVIDNSGISRDMFILELTVLESVNLLRKKGFVVSYYISYGCFKNGEIKEKCIREANSSTSDFLSFDYRYFDVVEDHFRRDIIHKKPLLVWNLDIKLNGLTGKAFYEYKKMSDKENIHVVLIPYITEFDR